MDLELAKEERAVLDTVKGEFGFLLPPSLQKNLKDYTLQELGISEADLNGDPDRQQEYLTKFKRWLEGATLLTKYRPLPSANNVQSAKTKREPYTKTYERRYHLVEFVIDSWMRDNRSRIDWERVTSEWNEAHPYDRFVKPISLKSLFNKAIREPGIIAPFLFGQVAHGMMAVLDSGRTQGVEVFENYADKVEQFCSEFEGLEASEDGGLHPFYELFWVLLKYLTFTDKLEANRRRNEIVRTLMFRNIPIVNLIHAYVREQIKKEANRNERSHRKEG